MPVLLPASASGANSVAWGEQILKVAESTVNEMILKERLMGFKKMNGFEQCNDKIVGTGKGEWELPTGIGSQPYGFRAEYKCRYVATMRAY